MDWFRLYGDMPDDPKVGTLSDTDFRTWIELLCLACKEESDGLTSATDGNVTWLLRRNVTDSLQVLLQRGLLYLNDQGRYGVSNWEKRQKKSDSSKSRVSKFRELKRNNATVTLQKRDGNGPEKSRAEKSRAEQDAPPADFQKVYDAGSALFPQLASQNTSAIRSWLDAGCNVDLDILPELKRQSGKTIKSWTYFTGGIMDAKATREQPPPTGKARYTNKRTEPTKSNVFTI